MLHYTTRAEWAGAQAAGEYRPRSMAVDGFIHLSFGHQLARVATQFARGAADLVALVVDPAALTDNLRVEAGYPHLYGPVPLNSVRLVVDFPPQPDGTFLMPEQARLAELALLAAPTAEAALARAKSVMDGFAPPWWLGGGWAVDAATGATSRPHLDLDIVVVRSDAPALGRHLADWDLRIARDGTLPRWDGHHLAPGDHQIWARPDDGLRPDRWQDFATDPGFVEFLAEEVDSRESWAYRRDPTIRAPLQRLGPQGGFLAPEVALLYKASAAARDDPVMSAKARADFDHAVGHLGPDQRDWLKDALERVHLGVEADFRQARPQSTSSTGGGRPEQAPQPGRATT